MKLILNPHNITILEWVFFTVTLIVAIYLSHLITKWRYKRIIKNIHFDLQAMKAKSNSFIKNPEKIIKEQHGES